MANTKITNLAALTASTGDEIPVNRAGSDGKITVGGIRSLIVSQANSYVDIRDYSATPLVSGSDITAPLQAALADHNNHGLATFYIPRVGDTGFFTWDPAGNTFAAALPGRQTLLIGTRSIKLSSQFVVRSQMQVKGLTTDANFTYSANPGWCPTFTDLNGNITTGLLSMSINSQMENISVDATAGPALSVFGTNLFTIKNCKFTTGAAANCVDINVCFWVTMENIYCQPRSAGDFPALALRNASPGGGGTDCGLIRIKDLRMARNGVFIQADRGPVGTRNIVFEDVICENMISGNDLFTFDSSGGNAFVGDIKIVRPEIADPIVAGTNYWLNVNSRGGESIYDINVEGRVGTNFIRPTSDTIKNLVVNHEIPSSATIFSLNSLVPIYAGTDAWMNWKRETPTSIDARLLTAPVGFPWVPGTPLAVVQDPAGWTPRNGATITTGVLAPDGSTMAGRVSAGSGARAYSQTHTLAVGDWLIGGVWLRATSGANLNSRSVAIGAISSGFQLNGTSSNKAFNTFCIEDKLPADGWRWFGAAYKVTAIGTNPGLVVFDLANNGGFTVECFNPCAVLIPSGTIDDAWALNLARSLKGGWPSGANAGDVGVLNHQRFRLAGGAAVFSSTVSPTTGTGIVGDIAFNKSPTPGAPMGWVCVAAGTPGTWLALATIPAGSSVLAATGTGTALFGGSSTQGQGILSVTGGGTTALFSGLGAAGALGLLNGETQGFAIDATTEGGTVAVVDTGTPANNLNNVALNSANLTNGGTSSKYVQWNDDTLHLISSGQIAQEWDGTRFGMLIEPAATNRLLQSQTLDNASWTKTNTSITADVGNAPDGTLTSDLLTQGASGSTIALDQSISTTGSVAYTYSVFAKRGNSDWIRLTATNSGASVFTSAWFNLTTGVVGTTATAGAATVASTSIVAIGGDWYRLVLTGTTTNTTTLVRTAVVTGDGSNTRVAAGTVELWGFQAELGSAATSYVPTTTTTVTRAADNVGCATSTYPHLNSAGTFIVWVQPRIVDQSVPIRVLELNNGSVNEVLSFVHSTTPSPDSFGIAITAGGVGQTSASVTIAGSASLIDNRLAVFYQLDNSGVLADAGSEVVDTSCSMCNPDAFNIGYTPFGAREFNGRIYQITYVPRRMSEAEMQALTA